MSLQTLILRLDGVTAGDYLAWCRDPDASAFDYGLRSTSIDADPLGDTISAGLDWDRPMPPPRAAATIAGLPLTANVRAIRSPHAGGDSPHASHRLAVAGRAFPPRLTLIQQLASRNTPASPRPSLALQGTPYLRHPSPLTASTPLTRRNATRFARST
jgi:hypothetical protein